ncbi:FG-GAP repeat domain-containing protein [Mucilaginibacter agri]|uniref:VCBS repeat-containing protein n=1 Tax=Mucilaginibacter agri TaxID=2695265 RepID=A0A965ZHN9_9SPHI|nr:VCBS repeat-containing protein [Mucilaginibacter agri]NCD71283.1 VCBS repeat-containing protein [Mucilaginibacter agri]
MFKISKSAIVKLSVVAGLSVVGAITFNSCGNQEQSQAQLLDGHTLAKKYCVSCHMLPEPALADKKSWEQGILPAMAKRLKLKEYMGQIFSDEKSALTTSEWAEIVKWYVKNAPDSLVIPKPAVAPLKDWSMFSLVRPKKVKKQIPAMTTMVAVSPDDHQLYSADAANNLYRWTPDGKSSIIYTFDSPVTGVEFAKRPEGNIGVFTTIGNMIPIDVSKGKIQELNLSMAKPQPPLVITDSLPRPVQTVTADFNKDGLTDYVVCGFGHDRGGLYYVQQQPGKKYEKHLMLGLPGGTQLVKGDFNNDGWMDVMCLFAQNDEGIWMFLNNKKGGFEAKQLMRFPPIYGSSSFQLIDFNHDGKLDLLYTCGDNSDYSKVLKPYHGIYIFTNLGNWKFKQTYFYHMDGCSKAIAADFDGDGDLDIAAIGFFSDFKYHPEEGFTYLEQSKPNAYIAHQIPVQNYGRWICMDVNDVDHNGTPDIILGNFSIGERGLLNQKGFAPKWDMSEPLIILRNNAKK